MYLNVYLNYVVILFVMTISDFGELVKVKKFPTYIEKCHQTDSRNFNKCLLKAIQMVKPHLTGGIPEFRLPRMDPLILPEIGLDAGAGFVAKFQNVEIYDADKFTLKNFDIDLSSNTMKFDLDFPFIRIKAHYRITGRIMFFDLNGGGPAQGNITGVQVEATVHGERLNKQAKEFLQLREMELTRMNFGKPDFYFHDLFRNNVELTEQTNKILNANMEVLLEDLRPTLEQLIAKTVLDFISRVFNRFSIDELFPK